VILGRPYLLDGSRLIIHRASASEYLPFEEHHYLSGHAVGTRCFLSTHHGELTAWISLIWQVGSGGWRVHRLVVLPEHRHQGIAQLLVTWIAEQHTEPVSIRTRNAAFVEALIAAEEDWRASRHGTHPTAADSRTGKGSTVAATAVYRPDPSHRCEVCRVTFRSARKHSRYCSGRCRTAAYRDRRAA